MPVPRPPARRFVPTQIEAETWPYAVLFGHGASVVTVLIPEQGQAPQTTVFPYSSTGDEHRQAEFDAFSHLYRWAAEHGEQLQVCVTSNHLRAQVEGTLANSPGAPVALVGPGPRSRILTERHAASNPAPKVPETTQELPRLLVGTDASWGSGKGVGIACISEDGRWAYRSTGIAPRYAEMAAILLAADTFPGVHLTICTDSLVTVGVIANGGHTAQDQRNVAHLLERSKDRDITVSWVRGHEGTPINEAAHRLAMNAYRHGDMGIAASTSDAVAKDIAGEFVDHSPVPIPAPKTDARRTLLLRRGRVLTGGHPIR